VQNITPQGRTLVVKTVLRIVAVPSPQCHPSVVGSMPPRIRKICEALETLIELSDPMEPYIEEKGFPPFFKTVDFNCLICSEENASFHLFNFNF
jgi:hypothetical protein